MAGQKSAVGGDVLGQNSMCAVNVRIWARAGLSSSGGCRASVRKLSMESASCSGVVAHFEDLELGDKYRDVHRPLAMQIPLTVCGVACLPRCVEHSTLLS